MIEDVGTTIDDDLGIDIVVVTGLSEVCLAEVVTKELLIVVVWITGVEVATDELVGWIEVVICVEVKGAVEVITAELVLATVVVCWKEVVICVDVSSRGVEVTTAVDDGIIDVLVIVAELVG